VKVWACATLGSGGGGAAGATVGAGGAWIAGGAGGGERTSEVSKRLLNALVVEAELSGDRQ
jgi:hypothetical protein